MSDEKVVELKSVKKKDKTEKEETETYNFEEVARKNKENEERLKMEHKKHNKGVIRSYRLE